jgi:hypothetical protein
MGALAKEYFDKAAGLGGLRAKIRLATLARVTSTEADTIADSPQMLESLERAFNSVRDEFYGQAERKPERRAPSLSQRSGDAALAQLRRQSETFVELMTQRSLFLGNTNTTLRRITEAAAVTLDVARASVWFVDPGVTKIVCADLFECAKATHSSGTELFAKDFGPYFQALRAQRTIAAHDAHMDPRTSCFSAVYLTPLGINSMLDVPIWVNQDMVGVVCHEHVGPKRTWNRDEEQFAYLMASFVALAMERGGGRPSRDRA